MITPDTLTEYVRKTMPDAAVTVSDRTGTMNHLKVVVISAAFAGKNLLDRHRMIYQALDAPMKGRADSCTRNYRENHRRNIAGC